MTALVLALGLTVFGTGTAERAVADFDASSWLWSSRKGEVARVNGITGRVDTRYRVVDAQGHVAQISQTDRYLIMRDVQTGKVSAIDLAALAVPATMPTTSGLGVTVALSGTAALVVDTVQGTLRQLDPATLAPVGGVLRLPPGLTGGAFDASGLLWLAVPGEGTAVAIQPAKAPSAGSGTRRGAVGTANTAARGSGKVATLGSGDAAAGQESSGTGPHVVRTVPVAEPSHDLAVSVLDDGIAVLDRTDATLSIIHGGRTRRMPVPGAGTGELPDRTAGGTIAVTMAGAHAVYLAEGGTARRVPLPGQIRAVRPVVPFAGRLYCADGVTGTVYVLDASGRQRDAFAVPGAGGRLELEVRENRLFVNAPETSAARVVDPAGRVRGVDKYASRIVGGDPPETPPAPPPQPESGPPGPPARVVAAAGNGTARVSWAAASPNGSPVTAYLVRVIGPAAAPPGGPAAGATPGRSAVGSASGTVAPLAAPPGTAPSGTASPATPRGAAAPTVPPGTVPPRTGVVRVGASQRSVQLTGLVNGTTYRFAVHAVNARGAGPARTSNPVVPTSNVPAAPPVVTATARPDGTVLLAWPAADGLGRRVVRYSIVTLSTGVQSPVGESTAPGFVVPAGAVEYGRQYAFSVIAVNDIGAGSAASPPSGTVVPYTVPGPPRNLGAHTATDQRGTVVIGWDPADDHGRPVTGYRVAVNDRRVDTAAAPVTVTGLGDAVTVRVSVIAVNAAGAGPAAQGITRTVGKPTITLTGGLTAGYNALTVPFAVDDGGGRVTCTLVVSGAGSTTGGCTRLTAGGLWPGRSYTYTVSVRNPAGTASVTGSVSAPVMYGTVICPDNSGGYCDSGIWWYRSPTQSGTAINPPLRVGATFPSSCWVSGGKVNAIPWGGKNTPIWIRIAASGTAYFPWAWTRLDGGDNYRQLPPC